LAFKTAYTISLYIKTVCVRGESHFISRHASTQHRANQLGIDIVGQDGQIIRIQRDIFLETTILMMQMVGALHAVLLRTRETEFASATDATCEPDADQASDAKIVTTAGTQSDDSADSFVTTDVRQLDVGNGLAVCSGGDTLFGVQV
jgi:hypothetical protein